MTDRPASDGSTRSGGLDLRLLAQRCGLTVHAPEGGSDVVVTGVALDNRRIAPGDVFAALPGLKTHGAAFARSAAAAGAVAVLTDRAGLERAAASGVPVLLPPDDDARGALARLSALVHGYPTQRLSTFAVTGTNGKTTTTFLLAHVLDLLGRRAGLLGTVELRIGGEAVPARLTTPEAPELQALAARMLAADDEALVMEVSSHALAQRRVDEVVFDVAGFTHLSLDHLDFHGGLEPYFAAKAALFRPDHSSAAVVCVDDEWGARLAREAGVPVTTLRTRPGEHPADWWVDSLEEGPGSTRFALHGPDGTLATEVNLPGDFNVANAALALVMAVTGGFSIEHVQRALDAAGGLAAPVPGRMELVGQSPRCVVDFAHNTDALERALATLRSTTTGRLHVVFGATGERDVAKRPEMGRIAARLADVVVVTDDDPHDEDPALIRAAVLAGAHAAVAQGATGLVREVAPRAAAIAVAVAEAAPDDTVLIAGRGHETVQEVAGVDLPLDDRAEVRAALALRAGASSAPTESGSAR